MNATLRKVETGFKSDLSPLCRLQSGFFHATVGIKLHRIYEQEPSPQETSRFFCERIDQIPASLF